MAREEIFVPNNTGRPEPSNLDEVSKRRKELAAEVREIIASGRVSFPAAQMRMDSIRVEEARLTILEQGFRRSSAVDVTEEGSAQQVPSVQDVASSAVSETPADSPPQPLSSSEPDSITDAGSITGGAPLTPEDTPKRRRFGEVAARASSVIRDARDNVVNRIDSWEEGNKRARVERKLAKQTDTTEFTDWREQQFMREGDSIKATRPWMNESLVLAGWNDERQQAYSRALGKWKLSLDTLLNKIPEGGLVENLSGKERKIIAEGNAIVYAYMNAELKRRARIESGKEKLTNAEQQALQDAVGRRLKTAAGVEFEFTADDLKNFYARRGGWLGGFGSDIKAAQRELSARIFAILGQVPRLRLGFRNKVQGTNEARRSGGSQTMSEKMSIDRRALSGREKSIIDVLVARKDVSRSAADKYLAGEDAGEDAAAFAKIDDIVTRHRISTTKH